MYSEHAQFICVRSAQLIWLLVFVYVCPEKGKVDVISKTGSEIGKQAAQRSGGLFSAEDWQCSV